MVVWRGRKERVVKALIAGYVLLIFVITVLDCGMTVNSYGRVRPIPLWSYSIPKFRNEIICNYLLFITLGALLTLKNMDWRKV